MGLFSECECGVWAGCLGSGSFWNVEADLGEEVEHSRELVFAPWHVGEVRHKQVVKYQSK